MKRFRFFLTITAVLCLFTACGAAKYDKQGSETPTPTASVRPSGTDDDGILRNNIFFRPVSVGGKETREFLMHRNNGQTIRAEVTSVQLNGKKYPYEVRLTDSMGKLLYHFYTEEDGEEAYLYEEQHDTVSLVGIRGAYYCPWIEERADGEGVSSADIMEYVTDKVKNYGTSFSEKEAAVTDYRCCAVGTVKDTVFLLNCDVSVPGTLLSAKAAEKIKEMEPPSEAFSSIFQSPTLYPYRIVKREKERILLAADGTEIAAICEDGTARWGKDEWFITAGYNEPEIDGVELSEFLLELEQQDLAMLEPGASVKDIERGSFEEMLDSIGVDRLADEYALRDAAYRIRGGRLYLYWPEKGGMPFFFGDSYDLFTAEKILDAQPHYVFRRQTEQAEEGLNANNTYPEAGTIPFEAYSDGERQELRFGDLEVIKNGASIADWRIGAFDGLIKAPEAGEAVFPRGLSYEVRTLNSSLNMDESFLVGDKEMFRIQSIRHAAESGQKPFYMMYLYVCTVYADKAVAFACPYDPNVYVVCSSSGKVTFRLHVPY